MSKHCFLILAILMSFSLQLSAQNRYWVVFANKASTRFDPYAYFDQKAIERRLRNNLSLNDSTDFPLNEGYIRKISSHATSIGHQSRWMNALAISATESQFQEIERLSFVKKILPIQMVLSPLSLGDTSLNDFEKTLLKAQTQRMAGQYFAEKGIDGKGIRIAIFDAGFPSVDVHPAFEHIRNEGRIKKTFDFTADKEFVYAKNPHGTMVLSCIAGIINGQKIGLATGAEFLLARTEVNTEPFSEEENWLAAVEWADKNGADIINSSLGYTKDRYFNFEMDGRTSFVVKAANLAARKGILVFNAIGNDGDNSWKYLNTPADADSILSIGGIDPKTNFHIGFSSFGPTTDLRLKPNLSAFGEAIVAAPGKIAKNYGTSFASPLVAGFAACAWQSFRSLKNMELFDHLQKSGELYPYYDYAHGFGVPQATYFTNGLKKMQADTTFSISKEDDAYVILLNEKFITNDSTDLLYFHISNKFGVLRKYQVIAAKSREVAKIAIDEAQTGDRIRIFYKGFLQEIEVKASEFPDED
jgi:serine protease AprX